MNNVAREPTQSKWQTCTEVEQSAYQHDANSNYQEQPAKFAEWVHTKSLRAERDESQRAPERPGTRRRLDQFVSGEEISYLKGRGIARVGAMGAIVADAGT